MVTSNTSNFYDPQGFGYNDFDRLTVSTNTDTYRRIEGYKYNGQELSMLKKYSDRDKFKNSFRKVYWYRSLKNRNMNVEGKTIL